MEKTWRTHGEHMENTWRKHGENMEKTWRNMTCDLKSKMINEWHVYGMSMTCLWMHVCCPKVFQQVVQLRSVVDENSLSATWQQPQNSSVVEAWLPQQNPSKLHPIPSTTSVLPVYYQCMTYSFPYFPNDFISLAFHIPSRWIGIRQ